MFITLYILNSKSVSILEFKTVSRLEEDLEMGSAAGGKGEQIEKTWYAYKHRILKDVELTGEEAKLVITDDKGSPIGIITLR